MCVIMPALLNKDVNCLILFISNFIKLVVAVEYGTGEVLSSLNICRLVHYSGVLVLKKNR